MGTNWDKVDLKVHLQKRGALSLDQNCSESNTNMAFNAGYMSARKLGVDSKLKPPLKPSCFVFTSIMQ